MEYLSYFVAYSVWNYIKKCISMTMNVWVTCVGTGSSSSRGGGGCLGVGRDDSGGLHSLQMMCCSAHISMNASLSHYLYIMATTPRRGQASSRLISPLTARPKEKWEARQCCFPLIHRLYLTPQPWIACRTHYMAFVISLYTWRVSQWEIIIMVLCTFRFLFILMRIVKELKWNKEVFMWQHHWQVK